MPKRVARGDGATQKQFMCISAGMTHSLTCTSGGRVFGFGSSRYGQVGTALDRNFPEPTELGRRFENTGAEMGLPRFHEELIVHIIRSKS